MRRVVRTIPAPEDLGTEVAGVRPGTDIELELRLEAVMEGVLVSGTATATMAGECGRCLNPVSDEVTVDLQELFTYPADRGRAGSSDDDDESPTMVEDLLDLEPTLRDALVLELPLSPLCDEQCAGLCASCGVRLDDVPPDHSHEQADPRWAALAELRTNKEN